MKDEKKMSLSQAIRESVKLGPQSFGVAVWRGPNCVARCALDGAAKVLGADWPSALLARPTDRPCHLCGITQKNLSAAVVHLNDEHRVSREVIATWVETIESTIDQTIEVSEIESVGVRVGK